MPDKALTEIKLPSKLILSLTLLAAMVTNLAPNLAWSQDIRFDHITVSDGLSQSTVNAILQDQYGLMWFGTSDGLNRYDGYNFQIFKSDKSDPTTLTDSWVTEVIETRDGTLWVGTYGYGLNRMNPDRRSFTRINLEADEDMRGLGPSLISGLIEDPDGRIWVGSNAMGIRVIGKDSMISMKHDPNDPTSLGGVEVRDLFVDRRKRIWVATENGVDRYDPATGGFIHYRHDPQKSDTLSSNNCVVLRDDREGFLWVGTKDAGLNRMDPETGLVARYRRDQDNAQSLSNDHVQCIYEDDTGNLWIGTENGLNRMRKDGSFARLIHDPIKPASVGHSSLVSLFEDRGGVLWVGTYGSGLSKFNRNLQGFRYYNKSQGLATNDVFAFHEAKDGQIWVGTFNAGINIFDPEKETFTYLKHDETDPNSLSHNHIYVIYSDQAGSTWVGTSSGLNRYVPQTKTFQKWFHDPTDPQSIASDKMVYLLEDHAGRFWIATYDAGLDLMDRQSGAFRHFTYDPRDNRSLPNNFTNYLLEDMENRLWVATELGLAMMERETEAFTRFRHQENNPNSLSHDSVMVIYQQHHDELWVGTYGGGLNRMKISKGTFTHYRQKDGLPNDSIYGILEDNAQNLWLSTNAGICKFNPQNETYTNFDTSNVLYYQEFNRGGFMERSDGELYFGGQGFYRFMPEEIKGNEYIPPVVITSFKKNGEEVISEQAISAMDYLELNHNDSVISFSYAAMDYTSPRKNRFRYQMTGLSEDWIDMGSDNHLTYSSLSPGEYTLRIKGSNSDGLWNPDPKALRLLVKPPLWAGRWAWFTYLLLALAISYMIYRSRERRKEKALQRAITVGKAQFASTVLHNIGNVLTSLQVSCDQGRMKLKESKIRQLLRAHNLMRDHMDDLAAFLTEDPKGKLLPGYFISAGEILEEEHDQMSGELDEMNRKITLMRDIIETQQAHAKQELISETWELEQVIHEALKVLQDTLERNRVTIETHFEELPPVKAQKSQLMHVIINLVKNAMDAMAEVGEGSRMLRIETGRYDIGMAFMKITDNGEGIPPDRLPNLFNYGFTTKQSGHGFGLHSCARTIREMGGHIRVESPGASKGATFTVTLKFGNPGE